MIASLQAADAAGDGAVVTATLVTVANELMGIPAGLSVGFVRLITAPHNVRPFSSFLGLTLPKTRQANALLNCPQPPRHSTTR